MDFGIPNLKKATVAKQEKYPFVGVITLEPTEQGKRKRMVFNSKAVELLEFKEDSTDNQVSFSFNDSSIYIVNTTGMEGLSELKVTKSNTISNVKHYEYIKSILNKEESDEVDLFLIKTENTFKDKAVFSLSTENPEQSIKDTVDELTNEAIEDGNKEPVSETPLTEKPPLAEEELSLEEENPVENNETETNIVPETEESSDDFFLDID